VGTQGHGTQVNSRFQGQRPIKCLGQSFNNPDIHIQSAGEAPPNQMHRGAGTIEHRDCLGTEEYPVETGRLRHFSDATATRKSSAGQPAPVCYDSEKTGTPYHGSIIPPPSSANVMLDLANGTGGTSLKLMYLS